MTKIIWVLPMDTGLPGPQFQYMKALNQMTSVVSSDICKATASMEADRSRETVGGVQVLKGYSRAGSACGSPWRSYLSDTPTQIEV